jgi:RNA polymerase sigma-70 factor, ECF subfamily
VATAELPRQGYLPLGRHHSEEVTDVELARQLREKVPAAHTFVFQKYFRAVHAASFRVLRSHAHAEDVVQRVFEELWKSPERFDPARGSLDQYLAMQGRSRSIDLVRSEVSRTQREQYLGTSARGGALLERTVGLDIDGEMRCWLDRLPFAERQVIQLAYYGQMTYREVAQLLELPDGTVKSRIRSGLIELRSMITRENEGTSRELLAETWVGPGS